MNHRWGGRRRSGEKTLIDLPLKKKKAKAKGPGKENFYLPSFQQHLNIMRSTYELLTI